MTITITICGSIQFLEAIKALQRDLEKWGYVALIPQDSSHFDDFGSVTEKEKNKIKRDFINSHLEKIHKSNAILIANYEKNGVEGYIGTNTLMEIAFAYVLRKQIFILNSLDGQRCKEEIDAVQTANLNADLTRLQTYVWSTGS